MATPIPRNEATFELAELVEATSGRVRAPGGATRGVVIDTRAVEPGCLFVALRGERVDAHALVADAVAAGARTLLVAEDATLPRGLLAGVVSVKDTTRALGDLAAHHRRRWGGRVIGITGSAGKTTTKELVAAALGACGRRAHRTRGNLNNAIGVPMTLLELGAEHEDAVIEMGTSAPGEIARLAQIAAPDVGLVTVVSAAHTEGLGSVEAVAEEKAALLRAVHPAGAAVTDGDDGTLRLWAGEAAAGRRLFFGREAGVDVRLVSHEVTAELETRCAFEIGGRRAEVDLRLLGEAAARNAAATLAVVLACGLDVDRALRGLAEVRATPGRMMPRLEAGLRILDDTYNANPRSTALALETAAQVRRAIGGRLVAVLGDMKELGAISAQEHAAIGRHAARVGVDALFLCGPEFRPGAEAARAARPELRIEHVGDAAAAISLVHAAVAADDVVLVKGSRSMEMEQVVGALAAGGAR